MASRRPQQVRSRVSTFESLEDRCLLAVSPEWLTTVENTNGFLLVPYLAGHVAGGFSATGRFDQTVDFDPGPGVVDLSSPAPAYGSQGDIAVARYSSAGDLLWARRIGDSNAATLAMDTGVDTDRAGNTYVLGLFQDTVQLDSQTLTGDNSDGFVAKLDADGNFLWAQPLRASSSTIAPRDVQGIAVDDRDADPANWSVFVSGAFKGTATLGSQTLKSTGKTYDTFIASLSASSGSFQWTRTVAGQGTQRPVALAAANVGAAGLYISGTYDTEAKVGVVTLTGGSYFLAKLNPNDGSTLWAKTVATAADFGALAATADGLVIGGDFSGTVDFDPGAGIVNLTSAGGVDSSLLKLDANGNFLWARRMGSAGNEFTQGLAVNAAGNVYLTGSLNGTADFGSQIVIPVGGDGFLAEVDAAGSFVGAYAIPDRTLSAAVDRAGDVYVAGAYSGTALDYFPTGDAAVSRGSSVALMKFSPTAPPIDPTPSIDLFYAAPATVFGGDTLALSVLRVHDPAHQIQTVTFYLDNGDGVLNPAEDVAVGADSHSANGWTTTVSTAGLSGGTYKFFAQASDAGGVALAEAAVDVDVLAVEHLNYPSPNAPKAILDLKTITSTLTVAESFNILDIDVSLNISHTHDGQLDVYLIGPDGTRVELFTDVGGTGDNFSGTVLDDQATTAITSGAAPFTGRFRPEALLSAFDGKNAAGVWTLEITDDYRKDTGVLNSWSLQFTRATAPLALAGGASEERARGLAVDTAGNIFVAGAFTGTANFDPGPAAFSLNSAGGSDLFVAKLVPMSTLTSASTSSQSAILVAAPVTTANPNVAAVDAALAAPRAPFKPFGQGHGFLDDSLLDELASIKRRHGR